MKPGSSVDAVQAAFNTSESVVEDVVKRAIGKSIQGKTRIIAGYDSEVYRVAVEDGEEIIVKINHRQPEVEFYRNRIITLSQENLS